MTSPWQFAIGPAPAALPLLRDDWHRLHASLPRALPYLTPEWMDTYLRNWPGGPGQVQLVTARLQGQLRAVMPLVLSFKGRGPLKLGIAMLLHNEHMALADVLAAPEDHALWPLLLEWLHRSSGLRFARLDLPGVADDSSLGQWLARHPAPGLVSVESASAADIDTRGDYDSVLKGISSNLRRNLSRQTKRAEAIGPLHYQVFEGASVLAEGLPKLLDIEASGWKGRAGTAIGSDPQLERFYRGAIEGLVARGQCSIGILSFGDRPAAAGLLLSGGRTVYLHKFGYREEWSAMGPGHLLLREMIERACKDPALDAIGLVLRMPWSDVWRPVLTPVRFHTFYTPSLSGRLAAWLAARRRAKAAAEGKAAPAPASVSPSEESAGAA